MGRPTDGDRFRLSFFSQAKLRSTVVTESLEHRRLSIASQGVNQLFGCFIDALHETALASAGLCAPQTISQPAASQTGYQIRTVLGRRWRRIATGCRWEIASRTAPAAQSEPQRGRPSDHHHGLRTMKAPPTANRRLTGRFRPGVADRTLTGCIRHVAHSSSARTCRLERQPWWSRERG